MSVLLSGKPGAVHYTNYDNYVGLTTWTKIGINTVEANDQGAFDPATNLFTAPVAGTYLFGASLLYKVNSSTSARMRGRLVLNGATEIRGSYGEISGAHVSEATALWLQTMVALTAGDTVELQGYFRAQDGYFAADETTFWGTKIG
ncbi:MAG: C1q-like domain-containing protein [Ruegeria sp.]